MSELWRCSKRGCGWIGADEFKRKVKIERGWTELRCPRCGCNSFYRAKPGDEPSYSVLPHGVASGKFLMICTGESYFTKIVDGGKLHEEWAIATQGSVKGCSPELLNLTVESMRNEDDWIIDRDHGPVCWKEEVGEIGHIAFWRLT